MRFDITNETKKWCENIDVIELFGVQLKEKNEYEYFIILTNDNSLYNNVVTVQLNSNFSID